MNISGCFSLGSVLWLSPCGNSCPRNGIMLHTPFPSRWKERSVPMIKSHGLGFKSGAAQEIEKEGASPTVRGSAPSPGAQGLCSHTWQLRSAHSLIHWVCRIIGIRPYKLVGNLPFPHNALGVTFQGYSLDLYWVLFFFFHPGPARRTGCQ